MIFTDWQKVATGEKTQTRRLVKQGEYLLVDCTTLEPLCVTSEPVLSDMQVTSHEGRFYKLVSGDNVYRGFKCPYTVGKTYAVQPAVGNAAIWVKRDGEQLVTWYDLYPERKEPRDGGLNGVWARTQGFAPLRIRITHIEREDVRYIIHPDAQAEGFKNAHEFLCAWCAMYDKPMAENLENFWAILNKQIIDRPERYQAWAITFELVKEQE